MTPAWSVTVKGVTHTITADTAIEALEAAEIEHGAWPERIERPS